MARRRLTASTVVRNPDDQSVVTLRAGQAVPDWAKDQVGDHLFESASTADPGEGKGTDRAPVPTGEPPRAGRGSGLDAWKAYAESLDIEVPDDAQRDDVIELVDQHNEK